MMKYGMLIFMPIFLTVCSASAQNILGGEPLVYNFQRCEKLVVNITNAVLNEWNATPNCTEQSAGNFYCTCVNNYNLTLTPEPDSAGTFSITMGNYWMVEQSSCGNCSGTGGTTLEVVYKNITTVVEKPIYITNVTNQTAVYVPINNTNITTKIVYQTPNYIWVLVVVGLVCAFLMGVLVIRFS